MKFMYGLAFLAVLVGSACSASSSKNPPTSPTSTVPTLTFSAETATPVGEAIAVTLASRDQLSGMTTLAVSGFNLRNLGSGVGAVAGRVTWDTSLLALDAVDSGDWFRTGGGLMGCCKYPVDDPPGSYTFLVSRENGSPPISGSGEIFLLRLKPRQGVVSGTSRIQFAQFNQFPPVYLSPNVARPLDNLYGGTVTIR